MPTKNEFRSFSVMIDMVANWWDSLNFEYQVFMGIAIISLIALLMQLVMTFFFGLDDMDGFDVASHDSGMGIFSVRTVTAFFTGFGWAGVICKEQGLGLPISLMIAMFVGTSLMFLVYFMMRSFMKLQSSGTLDYGNAVGQIGTVYLTVPPVQRSGGQVETMIQGRLVTAEALQKGSQPLTPGTKVKVVERIGATTLVVEPLD